MQNLYSVRDNKVNSYSPVFPSTSSVQATRDFERACNDANTQLNRYPSDFDLFQVGTFDDQTGVVTPINPPIHVVSAASLIKIGG